MVKHILYYTVITVSTGLNFYFFSTIERQDKDLLELKQLILDLAQESKSEEIIVQETDQSFFEIENKYVAYLIGLGITGLCSYYWFSQNETSVLKDQFLYESFISLVNNNTQEHREILRLTSLLLNQQKSINLSIFFQTLRYLNSNFLVLSQKSFQSDQKLEQILSELRNVNRGTQDNSNEDSINNQVSLSEIFADFQ